MVVSGMLHAEHSKEQTLKIVSWIGKNEKKLEALMQCFFSKDLRLCQRSSWAILFISQVNPSMMLPYSEKMIRNLDDPLHDAVIRNTIRIFEDLPIPESIEGELLEKCFAYINNPKLATAIRAFAVTVSAKIVLKYPELKEELIATLEDHMPYGLPSFKFRAKKIIKQLKSL